MQTRTNSLIVFTVLLMFTRIKPRVSIYIIKHKGGIVMRTIGLEIQDKPKAEAQAPAAEQEKSKDKPKTERK